MQGLFTFVDPGGNVVEMIARSDLNYEVPGNFSPDQIFSVSEVGVVFPGETFDDCVDDLMQQYGLSYFEKQPPLPQFRAIGDDNGLFICVPGHRPWYPTKEVISGCFPLEVSFTTGSEIQRIRW